MILDSVADYGSNLILVTHVMNGAIVMATLIGYLDYVLLPALVFLLA